MSDSWQRNRFSLLGVPLDVETNDGSVLQGVAASLGEPRLPGQSDPPGVPVVRLRLSTAVSGTDRPQFRSRQPHLLEIEGPGFRGSADGRALTADLQLTPAALAERTLFQDTILATLTLFLVTRLDRQPFHAAALQHHGQTLLLTGPSGAGKSTLSYAAVRRGWNVLSDDAVYLQSRPQLRIWARSAQLHLAPAAAQWFTELAGQTPVLRDNGKQKLIVNTGTQHTQSSERAVVCLLQRSTGVPEYRVLQLDDALARLLERPEPGFDVFAGSIEPVLRTLLQSGAWLVQTGSDPRATIVALEQLLAHKAG
jgi:hypothetical protein